MQAIDPRLTENAEAIAAHLKKVFPKTKMQVETEIGVKEELLLTLTWNEGPTRVEVEKAIAPLQIKPDDLIYYCFHRQYSIETTNRILAETQWTPQALHDVMRHRSF